VTRKVIERASQRYARHIEVQGKVNALFRDNLTTFHRCTADEIQDSEIIVIRFIESAPVSNKKTSQIVSNAPVADFFLPEKCVSVDLFGVNATQLLSQLFSRIWVTSAEQEALASRLFLKKFLIARKSLYDRFYASRADPFSCVDARGKSKSELVDFSFVEIVFQSESPVRVDLTFGCADAQAQSAKLLRGAVA
jgi:hypothetical protein